jgi:hypothetical protein
MCDLSGTISRTAGGEPELAGGVVRVRHVLAIELEATPATATKCRFIKLRFIKSCLWNRTCSDTTGFNRDNFTSRDINMSVSGILSSSVSREFTSVNPIGEDSHIQLAVKLGSLTVRMKAIDEVIAQKELELAKVGKELDALRIVAPLLRGEEDGLSEAVETTRTPTVLQQSAVQDEAIIDSRPAFFSWWERWREAANRFFLMASSRRHS